MSSKKENIPDSSNSRGSFSGRIGYVLAVAGSAVGLGNIWRFPYLAAKYGGGMFLLVYLILMLTFGYTLIVSETTVGRMTKKSPVGAFSAFGKGKWLKAGGWLNAIIPMLIVPYYCVIGGWVIKYLFDYTVGKSVDIAADGYFTEFLQSPINIEVFFIIFTVIVALIVMCGVQKGTERISKISMPVLVILAVFIAVYSVTRKGALEGVKYFLIPNFNNFSIMTVVAAMGQMFYSLSIGMGVLYTYGSYISKDVDIEKSTSQIEIFDTAIALLAGLMIIPAVFSFSGGDTNTLKAGPSLMFITLPKVFASMPFGNFFGILFFVLVAIAALTSAISLMETGVSTFMDELKWSRMKSILIMSIIMLVLGSLSVLGFNVLGFITLKGMTILDMFDFITNSVMMPVAALATCILVVKYIGRDKLSEEISYSSAFKRKKLFNVFVKYIAPVCIAIILISAIANVFGFIQL